MKKFSLGFTQHHFGDSQKLNKLIKFIKSGAGFTLVELLIVIAIIGVLATAAVSIINPVAQFQKANDARRKFDLAQIQKALEVYYQDQGRYPTSSSDLKITDKNSNAIEWGTAWTSYMGTLPIDPSSPSKDYAYYSTSDGQTYYIYASLERGGSDSQACNSDGSACSSIASNSDACGSACSYGVSSPNVSVSGEAAIGLPTGVPVPTSVPTPTPTPTPGLIIVPNSPSGKITATWNGASPTKYNDHLEVNLQNSSVGNLTDWDYANSCGKTAGTSPAPSGSCTTLDMPGVPGTYEVRLYASDKSLLLKSTTTFVVQ